MNGLSRDKGYLINVLRGRSASAEQASLLAPSVVTNSGGQAAPADLSAIIASELFTGNGAQTVFTLASSYRTTSCAVYLNGVRQTVGAGNDYVETGPDITFSVAPRSGATVNVGYIRL